MKRVLFQNNVVGKQIYRFRMNKIRLVVKGISGSQDKPDIYILILGEHGGNRVFPVVLGFYEAQSIAFYLDHFAIPKRPFIHDLFFELSQSCNVEILEVFIKDFHNSMFVAEVLCFNGRKYMRLDARLSDAVALSLRYRCPVLITEEVLSIVGVSTSPDNDSSLGQFSLEELWTKLDEAVKLENYEMAIILRNEIRNRTS
jgi:bifunctional DNase/RNase